MYDGLESDYQRLRMTLQNDYQVGSSSVSDEVCKWVWSRTQKATRFTFGPTGVKGMEGDFFGTTFLRGGTQVSTDNLRAGYRAATIDGIACDVPWGWANYRATPDEFKRLILSGDLNLPGYFPHRTFAKIKFMGKGGDSAFEDLGNNSFSYTVPSDRTLVLNYFQGVLQVNGIRLKPTQDEAVYKGGNFIFGPGERIVFKMLDSDQIAGFTINSSLASSVLGSSILGPK
jgi:hypothetical protein